ncbi:MAG TPA: cell division topological specificity factor MinE [Candidatus Xenobia bacterium]|jgi:cell division topological specificity factor
MFDFINRFFKKEETDSSSQSARNRLKLVLIQDRAQVAPELMDSLRFEMIQLLSRYMVIDEQAMSVELERREGAVALAASIPVINIRRNQPPETLAGRPAPVESLASGEMRRARYLKRKREALRRRRSDNEGESDSG